MSRGVSNPVVVWDLTERPDKKSPYIVRWKYLGREGYKPFKLKGQAKTFHAALVTAASNGERFSSETLEPVSWAMAEMNVANVAKEFVDSIKSKWAPKTRASNLPPIAEALILLVPKRAPTPPLGMIEDICNWLMSDGGSCPTWLSRHSLNIAECTRDVCFDTMEKLTKKRVTKTGESPDRNPNTVNRYRRAVSQLFGYAARRELITYNPWPQAERGKKTRSGMTKKVADRQRPSAEQGLETIAQLKNHQPISKDYQTLAYLIWHTGMRPSEARALRIEMCVLPESGLGSAAIAESVQGGSKRYWMDHDKAIDLPKTGNIRQIPLSPELVKIIREHISDRRAGLIFQSRNGKPISETNFERAWRRVRGTTNAWRLYDLRHTHATMAVRAGASPDKIAQWLGHDKEVLMNIYFGELPDDEAVALSIYESGLFAKKTAVTAPKSRPKTSKKSKRSANTTKKR